jgi:carboxylate-amine ligase
MSGFEYSFGVEEEFFLAADVDGSLIERMPPALMAAARERLGESAVVSELLQSQIELVSPVFHDCGEAAESLARARLVLGELAAQIDLQLIAAGTHPLGAWREQAITEQRRYDELFSDFRIIGQRNLVCGLHVHVATPPGVDRVDVMNRAMPWLPLFLALSTSSPFWDGRITGLLSYRQALYDEWPRSGLPDFFADESDYAAFAARLQRAGAIRDARDLWWAVRPALRYPTLELRIADACTRLRDAVALASLYRCLVALLVDEPRLGRERTTHTRRIIDENRWRAKRDGLDAHFIDEASDSTEPVAVVLERLIELAADQIRRLRCENALLPLRALLAEGSSAHAQVRIYNDSRAAGAGADAALRRVLRWLASETLASAS